ncbi:MAG: c-type cytochrome [Candidatus Thiodiazotropha sp.]|jgi:cytochrome c553
MRSSKRKFIWLYLLAATFTNQTTLAVNLDATEGTEIRQMLESRIAKIGNNKALKQRMAREGLDRTVLCRSCHGDDGMAIQPLVPNLAGQNPVYIVDQFQRFGDGRRYDYLMSNLAKTFSLEDKIKIAIFYSDMEMKPSGGGIPELLEEGKLLFKKRCVECHGENGRGQAGYALLAGQRYDYIVKMLKEFRDRTGRRTNVWMSGVAVRLNNRDIKAVATYLANLE